MHQITKRQQIFHLKINKNRKPNIACEEFKIQSPSPASIFIPLSMNCLLLTLFLAHNFSSLCGNLFFPRIAILTNDGGSVQYFTSLLSLFVVGFSLTPYHKLPIVKIEIWIQNFWCWLLLLHTGLSNLLNKCLQRRNSAEMLNESEEGKTKVVRISHCFSSLPRWRLIYWNAVKFFSAFSIHVYVTQFSDNSSILRINIMCAREKNWYAKNYVHLWWMCKELHLFCLINSSKNRSVGHQWILWLLILEFLKFEYLWSLMDSVFFYRIVFWESLNAENT